MGGRGTPLAWGGTSEGKIGGLEGGSGAAVEAAGPHPKRTAADEGRGLLPGYAGAVPPSGRRQWGGSLRGGSDRQIGGGIEGCDCRGTSAWTHPSDKVNQIMGRGFNPPKFASGICTVDVRNDRLPHIPHQDPIPRPVGGDDRGANLGVGPGRCCRLGWGQTPPPPSHAHKSM